MAKLKEKYDRDGVEVVEDRAADQGNTFMDGPPVRKGNQM